MNKVSIPYIETNFLSPLILNYLAGDERLKQFYVHPPAIEAFDEAINLKSKESVNRNFLADELIKQYAEIELDKAVKNNIEYIRKENTFCIVTAHQLNIFTGPLYVIYKTVSAINLCTKLKEKYPEYNFVPVFWLGSEDHDFEEINHIHISGKTFTWQTHQTGATGRMNPKTLADIIDQLKIVLGESDYANEIITLFSNAYLSQNSLAQATRVMLHTLFGKYGLLVIDADCRELKSLCTEIILDELQNKTSYQLVEETNKKLSAHYPVQANPREINLFYLKDSLRERILWDEKENVFKINNSEMRFSPAQIEKEADAYPERFSPNVILRPVFQQKILPAVAYVGGSGELSYWLQLKPLFEHYQIQYPVLILRNSVLWIEERIYKKIKKLELDIQKLFLPENDLINFYLRKNFGNAISMQTEKEKIKEIFLSALEKAMRTDVTLQKTVLAEQQNIFNALDKLEAKLLKAEKQKSETTIHQLQQIKQQLFPANHLQERYYNIITIYLTEGKNFIDYLIQNLEPLKQEFTIVYSV